MFCGLKRCTCVALAWIRDVSHEIERRTAVFGGPRLCEVRRPELHLQDAGRFRLPCVASLVVQLYGSICLCPRDATVKRKTITETDPCK